MSASFYRPKVVRLDNTPVSYGETQRAYDRARSPWVDSRDALQIIGDMGDQINAMAEARKMLDIYPGDQAWRVKARQAARLFILGCDDLEGLCGPTGRPS